MAPPGRSRRADILTAAEREFSAAGFSGGRIERIALAAGVNKQLLFHYFGSKEGLFIAALEVLLSTLEPAAAASATPVEDLRTTLKSIELAMQQRPGLTGIVADARANPDFPGEALSLVRATLARVQVRLAGILADGQRRGYFRDDIEPAAVARLAAATALGSATLEVDGPATPVDAFVLEHCVWR